MQVFMLLIKISVCAIRLGMKFSITDMPVQSCRPTLVAGTLNRPDVETDRMICTGEFSIYNQPMKFSEAP